MEFGDPMKDLTPSQFHGDSSRGMGSHRGSDSFLHGGPVHASMPTFEGRQVSWVSYSRVRARMVQNSDLQGEAIILGFKGPHNSSGFKYFALLVEIPIT